MAGRALHDPRRRASVVGGRSVRGAGLRLRFQRLRRVPDYTAGTWARANIALYNDVELREPADRWTVGGALRVERFDVFGATANGKLSARYGLGDAGSVRGGASTGFRVPTPGQQNTFNVQSTINPKDPGSGRQRHRAVHFQGRAAPGRRPLDPETSTDGTAGLVIDTGPFTLTADYFHVNVSDRLAWRRTSRWGADERALLLSEGITSAGTLAFSGSSSTTSRPGRGHRRRFDLHASSSTSRAALRLPPT